MGGAFSCPDHELGDDTETGCSTLDGEEDILILII